MKRPIWCEYVCRTCAAHIVGEFTTGAIPRTELTRRAKAKRAIFRHDEVFCSNRCLQVHKALLRTAKKEPCRWCGRPVAEQPDRPADVCDHA